MDYETWVCVAEQRLSLTRNALTRGFKGAASYNLFRAAQALIKLSIAFADKPASRSRFQQAFWNAAIDRSDASVRMFVEDGDSEDGTSVEVVHVEGDFDVTKLREKMLW